jgi:ankyrin repeat protein
LLAKGAAVNARCGATNAFLDAASAGHEDLVLLLLAHGADVNARAKAGWTALHNAAVTGQRKMAEVLLASGAEVNARQNGQTPLRQAVLFHREAVAELLRQHGGRD